MGAEVGTAVIDILERAGEQHIRQSAPECYEEFLWQIHGAGTLRDYDGSDVYWRRIQAAIDFFFTSEQRVEICRCLVQQAELAGRPECRELSGMRPGGDPHDGSDRRHAARCGVGRALEAALRPQGLALPAPRPFLSRAAERRVFAACPHRRQLVLAPALV